MRSRIEIPLHCLHVFAHCISCLAPPSSSSWGADRLLLRRPMRSHANATRLTTATALPTPIPAPATGERSEVDCDEFFKVSVGEDFVSEVKVDVISIDVVV